MAETIVKKRGRPKGAKSRATLEREIRELKARLSQPAPTPAPLSVGEVEVAEPLPTEGETAADFAPADPFADVPRDQAAPPADAGAEAGPVGETSTGAAAPAGTTLGEAGARAYLPLLFATVDTVACAGASWLLRRKLGAETARQIETQAHELMRLRDDEKLALEGALVAKLSVVELTPDEALLLAVLGIYAGKLVAVQALASSAAPTLVVSAA